MTRSVSRTTAKSKCDPALARLLYQFVQHGNTLSSVLLDELRTRGVDPGTDSVSGLDRLTVVFQAIPERAALYLAKAFLEHPHMELAPKRSSPLARYCDLVGEPTDSERQESWTSGWPGGLAKQTERAYAFWAEAWRLANYAAKYGRATIHGDTEADFQKNYTLHILAVLSNRLSEPS